MKQIVLAVNKKIVQQKLYYSVGFVDSGEENGTQRTAASFGLSALTCFLLNG